MYFPFQKIESYNTGPHWLSLDGQKYIYILLEAYSVFFILFFYWLLFFYFKFYFNLVNFFQ